ncbi:MAG: NAD(P)H-binding protein [Anaerolineaceae bacterium]
MPNKVGQPAIISAMILISGGTGFVSRALIRRLNELGHSIRILIRPAEKSPSLPVGIPVEVAVCSLSEPRGLRVAMKGVKTVFHLASSESSGNKADLMKVDIQGTENLAGAARDAGVDRIYYLSHIGADRASAYPILKAKGIAETHIRNSGMDYTIFRTTLLYGIGDHLTTGLARLLNGIPLVFLLPGGGESLIQPLWIEDLVTCILWSLEDNKTRGQTYILGGPEFLSIRHVVEIIMRKIGIHRWLVPIMPAYLRALTVIFEQSFQTFPVSVFWLDYLAADRTTAIDSVARNFGLLPSLFESRLDYLSDVNWRSNLYQLLFRRKRG